MAGAAALGLGFSCLRRFRRRHAQEGRHAETGHGRRQRLRQPRSAHLRRLHPDLLWLADSGTASSRSTPRATRPANWPKAGRPSPAPTTWIFNIRKGVDLHLRQDARRRRRHLFAEPASRRDQIRRQGSAGAASPTSRSSTANQIEITLTSGDAGLPYDLRRLSHPHRAQRLHRLLEARRHRRLYARKLRARRARLITKNKGDYWKPGRGNFDSVELRYIPDAAARTQALISGQIDAGNRLDAKTVSAGDEGADGQRRAHQGHRQPLRLRRALRHRDPYTNNDLRLALKYGIDRQKIIDTVYNGFATMGNDTTVAPSQKYLRQGHAAAALRSGQGGVPFQEGGHQRSQLELQVSEGAFSGATDGAVLYQEALKKAGIDLDVKRVSGDGYWDNVWLKVPFCAVYWGGRPTADNQLTQTFLSNANWNDTNWKRPEFDKLIIARPRRTRRRPSAARCTADAQQMIVGRRRHGLLRHRRLSRRLWQEGEGHGAASALRHVRPAHRRKGLVRLNGMSLSQARTRGRPVLRLIATRVALGLLTLLAVSVLIFVCTQILPGDVASRRAGPAAHARSLTGVPRRTRPRSAGLCALSSNGCSASCTAISACR